jgi:predicted O-linked N-acetylglucosamine transferase (SPINDLY family)
MLKWLLGRRARALERMQKLSPPPPAAATAPRGSADELMREAFSLHQAGNVPEAERRYREILAIDPAYADAHYLLGRIAQSQGRHEDAVQHVRHALRANASEAAFHRTLGEVYYALGRWNEAAVYLQNAAERDPGDFETWTNLGCACEKVGKLAEAARHFERALELAPESPQALNNCAMSLKDRGRVDEAIAMYHKARTLMPGDADLFSNYLYNLNYSSRWTPEAIWREHVEYDRAFGSGRFAALVQAPLPRGQRRIRIGYFSPDLRSHPVHVFVEPVLRHRDRSQFEVFCYNLYPWPDRVSERLKTLCDHWVDCGTWDDERLAGRIVEDGIDLLVDLAGHTGNNRLPVLGRKPAPVIATWLGYPNTTGLKTVGYRITDAVCDPPGTSERYHTESLLRLRGAQWCFLKPDVPVAVSPLPAALAGAIRFGSFNNASKLTEEMVLVWARVLLGVASSSLLIWGVGSEQRERISKRLGDAGIGRERLEFVERTPFRQQLECYQRVDIAFDTHPYSGVTTTFNSLWMGVPVLTLTGDRLASRSSSSILGALGLQDWVADNPQAFVELAAAKARDLASLAALRIGLRERLERSALMDGKRFTQKLEDAFREMTAGAR